MKTTWNSHSVHIDDILWGHGHAHLFPYVYACFRATMTELSSEAESLKFLLSGLLQEIFQAMMCGIMFPSRKFVSISSWYGSSIVSLFSPSVLKFCKFLTLWSPDKQSISTSEQAAPQVK